MAGCFFLVDMPTESALIIANRQVRYLPPQLWNSDEIRFQNRKITCLPCRGVRFNPNENVQ